MTRYILPLVIVLFSFKGEMENTDTGIQTICIRDSDSLYVKIKNNGKKSIYVSSDYSVDFYEDGDTVFLEAVDRPEHDIEYYFRYSNVLPYTFVTAKQINGVIPDTVMKRVTQTYFYNQFLVRSFDEIKPGTSYTQKVVFNVPDCARVIKLAYYGEDFHDWIGGEGVFYRIDDFLKYDSLYLGYSTSDIYKAYNISRE